MKKFYFIIILLFAVNSSFGQDEDLYGVWVMNSIFDYDILLEPPLDSIIIDINSDDNSITVESFCNVTYQSLFEVSNLENGIEITDGSWNLMECSQDNQGYEIATANLLSKDTSENKLLTYNIITDNNVTTLELTFDIVIEGIPTGVSGSFTKLLPQTNTALLNDWYIDYVVVDDVQHNNYYNEALQFSIMFSSNTGYEGQGSCNYFGGDYTSDSSTITLNSMAITLVDCNPSPRGSYENSYFFNILGGNAALPNILNYTISGTNNDAVLTITNPNTGDYVVYGRLAPEAILVRTWYLTSINIPGNPTINIPINESPTLTLSNDFDPVFYNNLAQGNGGECNSFSSQYDWSLNTDGDHIQMIDFLPTLADCGANDYESIYFEILSNVTNNYLTFEISEDGSTLTLTDLLGATLIYGDASLSTEEFELSSLAIKLKENPVNNILGFSTTQDLSNSNYEIFSITGKRVANGILKSNSINVNQLYSGLYVLKVSTGDTIFETVKFIKE